ncbi:hypothetical protein M378DRAFT_11223 [Amanita muscaria Koide BX008]|uniref:Crinkler effector protein N-terminal domain-containing protein n=1 Tax=Amanita muscaria (strain Koide BX008) TaxID=946122 RepID=A0A0C2X808_AMAMK|nr:hypothetical protein M378DRAFT_11223 [Amanita muscaria Koide BX008]
MSTTIDLYCWVLGEDFGRIFPVKIASTESVGTLKKTIKDHKRPQFDHVAADTLVLWNVSIPFDSNLEGNLENLDLDGVPPLSPWLKLSSVFSNKLTDDRLDIVVKPPIDSRKRALGEEDGRAAKRQEIEGKASRFISNSSTNRRFYYFRCRSQNLKLPSALGWRKSTQRFGATATNF